MTAADALRSALTADSASTRLQAAMAAGTHPDPAYVDVLVERCAVEPDFYVRDTLTWSLTRHPASVTVPRLIAEISTEIPQAVSQALHSLSKIGDPTAWTAVTEDLLTDPHDEIARTAWRAAVVLVPEDARPGLAATLATQLGRGDRTVQLSLSRALASLGDDSIGALDAAATHEEESVRVHAIATSRIVLDPDEGFEEALFEANKLVALRSRPGAV